MNHVVTKPKVSLKRGSKIRIKDFVDVQRFGGMLLGVCSAAAVLWANSPWGAAYHHLWEMEVGLTLGRMSFDLPLHAWISDALMAVFFFVVGLEIKRQILVGELSSPRQAALPLIAALGGMIAPAGIYLLANPSGPAHAGWGVPIATDIAFALFTINLLGRRVPFALQIFLTALAIADDLGSILVIGLFYTDHLALDWLALAGLFFGLMYLTNRLGIFNVVIYLVLGLGLWVALAGSGVHATLAGVLAAITIPARGRLRIDLFEVGVEFLLEKLHTLQRKTKDVLASEELEETLETFQDIALAAEPPCQHLEYRLQPWVTLLILPLFALANAGISLEAGLSSLTESGIALGVGLGLALGKSTGILVSSWLAVRFGLVNLPAGVTWLQLYGVGWLAGIGFTMSLFVTGLAFNSEFLAAQAKIGIFTGSLVSALVGLGILIMCSRNKEAATGTAMH